mgnify:FL=1
MQVVDAQIHLWNNGLPSNMSHRQVTSFPAEEAIALMDEAGVDAAVIHLVHWDHDCFQVAANAVAAYPDRFAMLGELPLDDPRSKDQLANLRDQPGLLGLRYILIGEHERQWLRGGDLDWLWAGAEEAGIPITLMATDSMDVISDVAERHPGLRLTIDHLGGRGGLTPLKDHSAMAHMPALLALAKHPNVAVKATGAPSYSSESYPFPIMQDYVRQIFDAFGPDRTFWGTDITKMPCSWRECIEMFTDEMPWLGADDQRLVMGDAVCAWWGWDREFMRPAPAVL